MISEKLKEKIRIEQICMNDSREIPGGMVFDEITIAEKNELIDYNTLAPFRPHGMIGEDLLLDGQDGRYYLAIKDGWGVEGGRLYGLKAMILLEFETSVSLEEMEKLASEPGKDKGTYAVMGERLKRERIRAVLSVLKTEQTKTKQKEEDATDTDTDTLKALIKELDGLSDPKVIEHQLQEIGKALITDYVMDVGNITVEPLWVEAYYRHKEKFNDPFVYGDEKQLEYKTLFFHHKTDDQRNGVDLCLSCGPYYLSFLLKYTLVDHIVRSQSELSPLIRDKYDENGVVLRKRMSPADTIVSYTTRIGLSSDKEKDAAKKALKEKYEGCKLAIVRDFDKFFITNFKFPHKESLVKEYLKQSDLSKAEGAEFSRRVLGYCLSEYKEK